MSKRRTHNPEFKSRFANQAITGLKTNVSPFSKPLLQALASLPIFIAVQVAMPGVAAALIGE